MISLLLGVLPLQLSPLPPFPHVVRATLTQTRVAPGVTYGTYDVTTEGGPIVVHAIEVAPRHPQLSFDTVLAHDALTSSGETVTSIARRSSAIAAINGDYFDINATNQPVNIVARNGTLIRTPRKRYALVITNDGTAHIVENAFTGSLRDANATVPITGINEMLPPQGEISILTPQYGPVAPTESITLVLLKPNGAAPFTSYTVVEQADNLTRQPPAFYLAIGPNAIDTLGVPNPGDVLTASGTLMPFPLDDIEAAIGGGPLILRDGAWYDDADGPRGGSYDMRAPQTGAALLDDGTLLLLQVDGRQPDLSIGLTPHEFSALMRAFGATDGMEFDSGGSSQMDVRIPGDDEATVVNSPSDGKERPIADALVIRDASPRGAAVGFAAQPQTIRALTGARVAVKLAAVDAAEHPARAPEPVRVEVEPATLGSFSNDTFSAVRAGVGALVVRSGGLVTRIPVEVSDDPASVEILPRHPAVENDGRLMLHARAYDARGYQLALPDVLPWRAQEATVTGAGQLFARSSDALVSLLLGNHVATARVSVGFREVPLDFTKGASFRTIPANGEGGVAPDPACGECISLRYSLGPAERAAYAVHALELPARTVGLTFDVDDDGSGALVKVALHNAIDEEVLLRATTLDGRGWKHVRVAFPANFAGPGRLMAIYVIGPAPGETHAGSISIRSVKAVVTGSE